MDFWYTSIAVLLESASCGRGGPFSEEEEFTEGEEFTGLGLPFSSPGRSSSWLLQRRFVSDFRLRGARRADSYNTISKADFFKVGKQQMCVCVVYTSS